MGAARKFDFQKATLAKQYFTTLLYKGIKGSRFFSPSVQFVIRIRYAAGASFNDKKYRSLLYKYFSMLMALY